MCPFILIDKWYKTLISNFFVISSLSFTLFVLYFVNEFCVVCFIIFLDLQTFYFAEYYLPEVSGWNYNLHGVTTILFTSLHLI